MLTRKAAVLDVRPNIHSHQKVASRRPRTLVAAGVGLATVATSLALVAPVASIPIAQAAVVNIMPLGDSLTQGVQDTDGTPTPANKQIAYRARLEDRLQEVGFGFDFVGDQASGNLLMDDPHHEAISGQVIAQISGRVDSYLGADPDVVLLMAGTNDLTDDTDTGTPGIQPTSNVPAVVAAFEALVDNTIAEWPGANIIIATLPPHLNAAANSNVNDFNVEIPGIAAATSDATGNVDWVDMNAVIIPEALTDAVHPDDDGYQRMGDVWFNDLLGLYPELGVVRPAPVSSDDFNEANGPLGNADTGETWTPSTSASFEWRINGNKAQAQSGTGEGIITLETGESDVSITAELTISPGQGNPAVSFRALDRNNQLFAGFARNSTAGPAFRDRLGIYKFVGGSFSIIDQAEFANLELGRTYDVRVEADGADLEFWVDDVMWASGTDSTFQTNSRHGLRASRPGEDGGSRWDNFEVRTPDFVPNAPTGLIATTPASATVALDWNDVADADGYRVFRSTGGAPVQIADVATSIHTDTTVTNGTTYTYTVRAYNAAGESPPSAGVTATPTADPDPIPGTPAGLSANPGNGNVGLDWNDTTGAVGYRVYRSTGGGAAVQIADVATSNYTDTTVVNGTTYTYTVTAYNTTGESAPSTGVTATPSAPPDPDGYVAIEPDRVIDTRLTRNGVRLPANEVLTIDVGSQYAGQALAVNLTAVAAEAGGFAKLWACDQNIPGTSSLNFQPGPATANGVITDVSATGTVCVTLSQNGHVILDLFGVFPNDASFTANEPVRIADTRVDPGARLAPNEVLTVDVGTQFAGKSVAVNLTAVGAADIGFATLWACDQAAPGTSSLNFVAAQAMANGVITDVSAQGTVCVTLSQQGHAIVDLFGVFPSNDAFQAIEPTRVVDSRAGGAPRLAANQVLTIDVGSQYANQSIAVNLTAANVADVGFAVLWACDQAAPGTSSLNFVPNRATANGVITDVSAQGTVCVTLSQEGHAILDLFGVIPS